MAWSLVARKPLLHAPRLGETFSPWGSKYVTQSCCGLSSQPERCMLKHGRSYSSPSALLLFHLAEGSCSRKRCCVTRWVPGEQGEHKGTEFWQCEMGLRSFSPCSCCPGGPGWVFQPLKLPLVWPVA